MSDTPQNHTSENSHEVSWLERRWRLFKASAKSALSYLTKPKTYLFAVGIGLALGAFGVGMAPSLASFGEASFWPHLAMYSAQMLGIGVLFHMVTDVIKEGRACDNDCKAAGQCAPGQEQARAHGQKIEQERGPYEYGLTDDHEITAPVTPSVVSHGQSQQNQPGMWN